MVGVGVMRARALWGVRVGTYNNKKKVFSVWMRDGAVKRRPRNVWLVLALKCVVDVG